MSTRDHGALITGAGGRIGRTGALALSQASCASAIHTHHGVAAARALRDEIVASSGEAAVVEADLADHTAVAALVPLAVAAVGPLTLLVNNAATFERDEVGALDAALWDRQFAVNLRAPVFLAEAFAAQALDGADAS